MAMKSEGAVVVHKATPTKTKRPHEIHDDIFEEAHATAAGAIMGARMAGKQIPAWTPDMVEAFRMAVAEAFDAGYRVGCEEPGRRISRSMAKLAEGLRRSAR